MRFRPLGEVHTVNGEKLIVGLFEARGEQSLSGFVITADRGYVKLSMVPNLSQKGIEFDLIMPEHLLRCHPFVGKSHFTAERHDLDAKNEGVLSDDDVSESIEFTRQVHADLYGRDACFIIDDSSGRGPSTKLAEKCSGISSIQLGVLLQLFLFESGAPKRLQKFYALRIACQMLSALF